MLRLLVCCMAAWGDRAITLDAESWLSTFVDVDACASTASKSFITCTMSVGIANAFGPRLGRRVRADDVAGCLA